MGGGEDLCDSLKRGLKGGGHSRWSAAGLEIRLGGLDLEELREQ